MDQINDTLVESKLSVGPVSRKDNGTYHCIAYGPQGEVSKAVPLFVLGKCFDCTLPLDISVFFSQALYPEDIRVAADLTFSSPFILKSI